MHEKLADWFEGILSVIVAVVGVLLGLALLFSLARGPIAILPVLGVALAMILAVGSISVLISIRRTLQGIRRDLANRG